VFNERFFLRVIFFQIICLIGLRGRTVGADTPYYVGWLEQSAGQPLIVNEEIGFVILREVFGFFIPNAQLYLLFVASAACYSFYVWILKYSPDKLLSAYIFFTFGTLSYALCLMRQFIALAIIIHGVEAVKERRLAKLLIIVCLAALFHKTAVAFILIYPVALWSIKRGMILLIAGKCLFSSIGVATIAAMLIMIGFNKYLYTLGSKTDSAALLTLAFAGILAAALFFRKNLIKNDKRDLVFFNFHILALFFLMAGEIILGINRISMYFSITLMLFIPKILVSIRGAATRTLGYVLVVIFGLCQWTFTALYGHLALTPYLFFWQ
jgi:hypothetical protein